MGILLLLAAMAAPSLQAEMQAVEAGRNAAISSGDMAALERLYAPDFHGIAGGGVRVDRATLFAVFRRNASGAFVAESEILSARREGNLVIAEGRLRLYATRDRRLVSDSFYLHIFRRRAGRWQMIAGSATPVQPPQ
ncbi:MAG TPA: nuclear transport factor 2 family protein [Allosphingosinicella sp.]|nr:nuclear transport factor 2 family protein [Allosphingosinicella sp.]